MQLGVFINLAIASFIAFTIGLNLGLHGVLSLDNKMHQPYRPSTPRDTSTTSTTTVLEELPVVTTIPSSFSKPQEELMEPPRSHTNPSLTTSKPINDKMILTEISIEPSREFEPILLGDISELDSYRDIKRKTHQLVSTQPF